MFVPAVSAVMPAYNAEKTIEAAVRSVLDQSFSELELVVCNDASVDRTADILASIHDPRLKVIHNPRNMGEGPARDNAIAAASAPWIAVIDADDVWAQDRVQRLLKYAPDDSSMVFDDLLICHDAGGALVPWSALRGEGAFGSRRNEAVEVSIEDYIRSDRLLIKPLMPAAVIKQNGLQHSDRRFGADTEYFIQLMGLGVKARFLPEALYWYRIAPGSMTATAKNPALMRHCIEATMRMQEWPESVLRAFEDKIKDLHRNETLYGIAACVRSGDVRGVLRNISANPAVLTILPKRVLRHLYYQLHRITHGGIGR